MNFPFDYQSNDPSPAAAMRLAIDQARTVAGRTSPNPPVGAVIVQNGVVVGLGATRPPGGPHAERVALELAGDQARGADLYVTLEPCTFHGRTPPCTEAIIAAGVHRVYYVARDYDSRMGAGAAQCLQAAGIETIQMPDPDGAVADLLAPFRCRVTAGRPLVTIKYAMTLDGRIATLTGASRWISGAAARRQVHLLRDHVDAIMVGVGTVLADDPRLTTRIDDHWRPVQHPLRVIADSHGHTPLSAQVLAADLPGQTLIATVDPSPSWVAAVTASGAQVLHLPPDSTGRVALAPLLTHLAAIGVNHVLVEGGAQLLGTLAAAGLVDEVWAFIGPKLVGGAKAPGPLGDPGVAEIADAQQLCIRRIERYDQDVLLVATAANVPWWEA